MIELNKPTHSKDHNTRRKLKPWQTMAAVVAVGNISFGLATLITKEVIIPIYHSDIIECGLAKNQYYGRSDDDQTAVVVTPNCIEINARERKIQPVKKIEVFPVRPDGVADFTVPLSRFGMTSSGTQASVQAGYDGTRPCSDKIRLINNRPTEITRRCPNPLGRK